MIEKSGILGTISQEEVQWHNGQTLNAFPKHYKKNTVE